MLVAGLAMAGLFGYIAGSSFVLQRQFGLDQQQFGLVFGAGAVWLIAATQFNAYLLRTFESQVLLLGAMSGGAVAALMLLAAALTGFGGLVGVLIPMWAVLFAVGLALPNAPALALSRHGEAAGTAAALLGAMQFGVGALVSPVVGLLGTDAVAMATVVASGLVLALAVLVAVVRPWTRVPDPARSADARRGRRALTRRRHPLAAGSAMMGPFRASCAGLALRVKGVVGVGAARSADRWSGRTGRRRRGTIPGSAPCGRLRAPVCVSG